MDATSTETKTPESIDALLIEVVARTKPKTVKGSTGRPSAFTQPRAWTMGGNVD